MINEQYQRAKDLLLEHKDGHNRLAELLLEREVIFAEDVEKIFGKRPWVSRSEEIMENKESNEPEHDGGKDVSQTDDSGIEDKAGVSTGDENI